MVYIDMLSIPVSRPLHRACVDDAVSVGIKAESPHEHPPRTDGSAILVDHFGGTSRCGIGSRPGVKGNNGSDAVIHEILIYASGIMSTVIDSVVNIGISYIDPETRWSI